jgi:hypothetical protein
MTSNKKDELESGVSKLKTLGSAGPFQILDAPIPDGSCLKSELDHPPEGPRRRYDCINYETCLKIAAALNWFSFTCRGCCGDVNEKLFWRAQQEVRKDEMAKIICDLPDARERKIENTPNPVGLKLVVNKS